MESNQRTYQCASSPPYRRWAREELIELYKLALEDYRFQVQINWGRSQYFLVLNTAIVSIATGLASRITDPSMGFFVAGVYFIGFLFCLYALFALRAQRRFYESARDQKSYFEEKLQLCELSITPVERAEGWFRKLFTIKGLLNIMLISLVLFNLASAIIIVVRAYFL